MHNQVKCLKYECNLNCEARYLIVSRMHDRVYKNSKYLRVLPIFIHCVKIISNWIWIFFKMRETTQKWSDAVVSLWNWRSEKSYSTNVLSLYLVILPIPSELLNLHILTSGTLALNIYWEPTLFKHICTNFFFSQCVLFFGHSVRILVKSFSWL